jgi:hypothetical protein
LVDLKSMESGNRLRRRKSNVKPSADDRRQEGRASGCRIKDLMTSRIKTRLDS